MPTTNGERNQTEKCTLYLTATPIGNLSDITERALKVLGEVNFIAAEDTRVTLKLLSFFGITNTVISYYEHNKRERGAEILERLKNGESCALVTDAGMPGISDPGEDLVRLCIESGINVTVIPGACAAVTALVMSGFDTRRFSFEGFAEGTKTQRFEYLESIKSDKRTLVFYESPHNLKNTLGEFLEIFGNRRVALCREITKLNEEVLRFTLFEAAEYYSERTPRGEYVLVLEGNVSSEDTFWNTMTIKEHVSYYIDKLGYDKPNALKAAAKDRGVSKSIVYKEFL